MAKSGSAPQVRFRVSSSEFRVFWTRN
ncbi:MAG: hypothetical protein HW385_1223, partial [candidate division NC10 bacterium]|nr:hypothetical protein [candidate division NC10 bacterium]